MGLYDHLAIEDGLDTSFPGLGADPTRVAWQTKSIGRPYMGRYKVTMDGRLYEADIDVEYVPEEDRPMYDEEQGGFESELHAAAGMFSESVEGWTDTGYHGVVEIHASVDDEFFSYDLKFTDGVLVDVTRNER